MIRQSIPETARWADTTYHLNPKLAEKVVKKLEGDRLDSLNVKSKTKPKP